jgi:hypothetical protein
MNGQLSRFAGPLAGVVFVFLIFLSLAVIEPLREATDAELLEWWSKDSNLDASIASMYTRLLAIPFLLVFAAQLRATLRAVKGIGAWADIAFSAGVVCAGMLGLSALVRGVTALSVSANNEPLPGVDMLRFSTELAYQSYSMGAIGTLAVMAGAAGLAVLGTDALARWLGWISIPIAALGLVAVPLQVGAFVSPLLLLWTLAACFCLATRRVGDEATRTAIQSDLAATPAR